jgi:type VI secretion system protein ImpG
MDSSPLNFDQCKTEYRIVPDPRKPYHFAIYSVDSVASWGHDDRNSRRYTQFESFEHEAASNDAHACYRLRIRPSYKDESTEMYISITHPADTRTGLQTETISLELTCTNRNLPGTLAVGDIHVHTDNSPDAVAFHNIIPVTPSCSPPLEGDLLWRLLSNMSLNYIALTDISALRAVISAYDFRSRYDTSRARILSKILQGMVGISSEETDRIYEGLPVRGSRTTLVLDQRNFSCVGDMYMFGSVLNEFFALYATLNSFHQLRVIENKHGVEFQWPARMGRKQLR